MARGKSVSRPRRPSKRNSEDAEKLRLLVANRTDDDVAAEMVYAGPAPPQSAKQSDKLRWALAFSHALAQKIADALRADGFEGVLPDEHGGFHESRARTAKGVKKLDVNYSTARLGLALGVSIKTINAKDPVSQRFVKNRTRVDNELRAEAKDYHERQPYAVMIALVFVPEAACVDDNPKTQTSSSFASLVEILRYRARRSGPKDEAETFERIFVGCYDDKGKIVLLDVESPPPFRGVPASANTRPLTIKDVIRQIRETYDARNNPSFVFAEGADPWKRYGEEDSGTAAVPDDEPSPDLSE